MQGAMMSGGCPCCQKMMKDSGMDMGMKDGKMPCSMMGDASNKGGMKCGCREKMTDGGTAQDSQKTPAPPAPVKKATAAAKDHTQHHPVK
jgi:hypothetical protein